VANRTGTNGAPNVEWLTRRMNARRGAMCLIVILSMIVPGCTEPDSGGRTSHGSPTVTDVVRDDLGREINLDRVPVRIISLAPNATEILFAIGAGDRIVGATEYCNYPPEALEIERVGSFSLINLERILALRPDLVISSSREQERFVRNIEDLGIPVYVCFPSSYEGLFRSIRAIGDITDTHERAGALADSLEDELDKLKNEVENALGESTMLRVYLEISSHPLMTAGENSFVGRLIEVAGGNNIARDIARDYAAISPEIIIARNPQIIFIFTSSTTPENLTKRWGWARIDAVKYGMVYDDLDEDRISRPGPRSIQGTRELFERLLEAKTRYGNYLDEE